MAWSGSDFQRAHNFSADASAGINILASRIDEEFDNFETGLEACLKTDGSNAPEADFAMGGYKHTNVGLATSANQYLRLDQFQKLTPIWAVYSGTSDAIAASTNPTFTALVTGHTVLVSVTSANTIASVTMNVNGTSAYPVRTPDRSALATGAVQGLHQYVFNGTEWVLLGGAKATQGSTEFTGTLNVSATAVFTKPVFISASTEIHGTLNVSGSASFDAVDVNGALLVSGSAEITGPLVVSGTAVFKQPVQFSSSAVFAGDVTFTGTAANLVPVGTFVITQASATDVSALAAYPADVTVSAIGSVGAFAVKFPSGNGPGAAGVVIGNASENSAGTAGRAVAPYGLTSAKFYCKTRNLTGDATNCERVWLVAYKIV